jgi:hypothetical protein
MTDDVQQLVRDTLDLVGGEGPDLLHGRTPALSREALQDHGGDEAGSFYLVGLIGGKDVGKSSLVNALVGEEITPRTSHGRGTDRVIAYVHEAQADALRSLLEREVSGRYRLVTHSIPRLFRQVLLDLPDIDSQYADHVEVTRRMLRHMLYPLWIQSVEKYADQMPQALLQRVAEGNAPDNFIFCLNKVDQVIDREGPAAAKELRNDYAQRLARTLKLPHPPRICMISAALPEKYDLPPLRDLLAQQKTPQIISRSKRLASQRQSASILAWLEGQNLPARAQRLARLQADAELLTAERLAQPLLERALPRLLEDPAHQAAMVEDCLRRRVARWPIVNIVHTVLSPLFLLAGQTFGRRGAAPFAGVEAMVDAHLNAEPRSVSERVQSSFAQLQQSSPLISTLYRHRKLWEAMPADLAAAELRQCLVGTLERQRAAVLSRLGGGRGIVGALFRWLLTVGAILWFPFIQPMLEVFLHNVTRPSPTELLIRFVEVLGTTYLLQNVTFLLIYFAVIWVVLKYHTQRRIARLVRRWKAADYPEPTLNLSVQALQWTENLLDEIRLHHQRLEGLIQRIEALRQSLEHPPADSAAA